MLTKRNRFLAGSAAFLGVMAFPMLCLAQANEVGQWSSHQIIALATGLAIALAAFGGALGQGRAAAAAMEGMARNPGIQPKLFTAMILGLAFIESLVLYALIIAFMLLGKV